MQPVKTGLTALKFLIVLFGAFATPTLFGQVANYTWTGASNGTNLDTPGNFTTNGVDPATTLPSGQDLSGTQESVIWDGRTTTNLNLIHGAAWPGTGLGSIGVNLLLTGNQTNDVQIISSVEASSINVFEMTNNSATADFILGDNTTNQLEIITRPGIAGTIHHFVNNSASAAVINSSLQWLAGGGSACVFDFGGTGNWTVDSNLRVNNGGGAISLVWDGPGTMTWSTGGVFTASAPLGPIVISTGTVILKSAGLVLNFTGTGTVTNNNSITNNGTLQYDAAAQTDTIARVISGTGLVKVSNGTLTLTGPNTYSGGTTISAGTLQVGTNSTGGSLGSGNVTNNSNLIFNRSDDVTITNVISGTGSVVQNGSGALTLAGAITYSGPTTVSNGTLATSSVGGDVNVQGGALVPVAVGLIGNLNVGGSLNISAGTMVASMNRSLSPSNSTFAVSGSINATGGMLKLLNFGPGLAVGDKFTLFNKQVIGGAGLTIIAPGFTVNNNLASDGSVTVASVAPPETRQITPSVSVGGTNLNLSWPSAWTGLHLQVQTNTLAAGLGTNWITIPGSDASNYYSDTLIQSNVVFFRLAP